VFETSSKNYNVLRRSEELLNDVLIRNAYIGFSVVLSIIDVAITLYGHGRIQI